MESNIGWIGAPLSAATSFVDRDGYTWDITLQGETAADLFKAVADFKGNLAKVGAKPAPRHATPAAPVAAQAPAPNGNGHVDPPAEAAPMCDTCGQPMTRKQRRDGSGSFWSCSTRYASGWCRGKPKAGATN